MVRDRLVSLSKRMSLALRHDPGRFGLTLGPNGWVPVEELVGALDITRTDFDAIVAGSDKQRFAVERTPDDVERVRARQGHSVEVDLELSPTTPPDRLYHGTNDAVIPAIHAEGLIRGARHHVHLSPDAATAHRVGARRRGTTVVLTVDAGAMVRDGHSFYRTENNVWLVDAVPPNYLTVLDSSPPAGSR